MWYDILKNIRIQKISDTELGMYISSKPMDMFATTKSRIFSFEYYESYSRDKLLEYEVETL
jgi:hypothetical protein